MSPNATLGSLKVILAILIAVGIVVGVGVFVGQAPAIFGADVEDDPTASITFEDQDGNGTSVEIQNVSLSEGGFVVVTDEDGDVLASSDYLSAGDHENVTVEAGEESERELLGRLTATAYHDRTDDGEFRPDPDDEEVAGDRPYVVDGYPVEETAMVTDGDRPADAPADSFVAETITGPSEATTTETVSFEGEIRNPTENELRQHVEFRIDGQLVERQVLTLGADESRELTIEVDLVNVEEGNAIYGLYTSEDGVHGEIDVEYDGPPSVSIIDADNETVSVDAGLPDGGFVAIEDADGDVVGTSDELDAGVHEAVSIEIDTAGDDTLTAVAYEGDPDDVDGATAYEDDDGDRITDEVALVDDEDADDADADDADADDDEEE